MTALLPACACCWAVFDLELVTQPHQAQHVVMAQLRQLPSVPARVQKQTRYVETWVFYLSTGTTEYGCMSSVLAGMLDC
jgi:hypothetical protein